MKNKTYRYDKKRRKLLVGESQREDGLYCFKYQENGKSKYIYSWRLVKSDPLPHGKKDCLPLRELEKQIKRALESKLLTNGGDFTTLELVTKYISLRNDVRENTRTNYEYIRNILLKYEDFAHRRIDTIKISDAKKWFVQLSKDGKNRNTIRNVRGVLRPAFEMAVRDELILKNPFDFPLAEVMKDDSIKRSALTKEQEKSFLKFIKYDEHFHQFYEPIYILFNLGLRVSELSALTKYDIDLENRKVSINKQLQYRGKNKYWIESTKTVNGNRTLPIPLKNEELYNCFVRVLEARRTPLENEPVIDGVQGFLFLSKSNWPLVGFQWAKKLENAVIKYNKIYKEELPKITPHIARHTFCTRLWQRGLDVKTISALMGHSGIEVTLDTYTHSSFNDLENAVNNMKNELL